MGYRLSKIVTKKGDGGWTGLGDGSRVPKTHIRVNALGDVDELNACLGLAISALYNAIPSSTTIHTSIDRLSIIQSMLFDLGAELSIPDYRIMDGEDVEILDGWITSTNDKLSPLEDFILPGGSEHVVRLHHARTVCRRAERSVVALSGNVYGVAFLNRLSDYLFVLARLHSVGDEVLWKAKKKTNKNIGGK